MEIHTPEQKSWAAAFDTGVANQQGYGNQTGEDIVTLLIIIGVVGFIGYTLYAGLIKKRNGALEALSGIDVQLKMRSDLIPNILAIAKKYMEHESEVLTKVTELRARADAPYDKTNAAAVSEHLGIAGQLASQMGKLQISMEAYPTLKADVQMTEAQRSYNEVEARISAARRAYNASVTALNNAVQIFPSSAIAKAINIGAMPFFETDEASKAPVNAAELLN
jgi:LemA protein